MLVQKAVDALHQSSAVVRAVENGAMTHLESN